MRAPVAAMGCPKEMPEPFTFRLSSFDIEAFDKLRLLDGLDDISLTLQHAGAIDEFERDYRDQYQWIF